jgi:hypothetical protein
VRKRPSVYETNTELTLTQLEHAAQGWILDGRSRQMSPRTIQERRAYTEKLCRFLREAELRACDTFALRAFLAQAAERPGRGGSAVIQSSTQAAYFRVLRAFFNFCVEEGRLSESPMQILRPPVVRQDQVQPFTHEQVTRLLAACKGISAWTFEPLDEAAFPAVALAKQVGEAGRTYPGVYNAANEQAVDAFHEGRLPFLGIVDTVRRVVDAHDAPAELTRESLAEAEAWARREADRIIAEQQAV